jgi:hypothetical protein
MNATKVCMRWALCFAVLIVLPGIDRSAMASLVASDNASDATYNDDWQSTDNGGSGWNGNWALATTSGDTSKNGRFVGDSRTNGDGDGNGDGDINTGRAWGLYANSGETSNAVRSFAGDLLVGQTFSISLDTGFIQSGGTVGFGLQNSSSQNLFEFYFKGGNTFYTVNRETGEDPTAITFTDEGLRLGFVLTDSNSFSLTIDSLANGVGVDQTKTGDLFALGDIGIEQVRLFNINAGGGDAPNSYFNSISISAVPEASSFLFGGLACGLLALRRRACLLLHRTVARD